MAEEQTPRTSNWLQAGAIALSLVAMLVANERTNEATRQRVMALEQRVATLERQRAEDDRQTSLRNQDYARLDEKLNYAIQLLESRSR